MASEMPSQVLQGCCLSMCPPSEMTLRNREGLVHPMECRPQLPKTGPQQTSDKNGGNPHSGKKGKKSLSIKGDPQYFVKEFARSSAGREIRACDVRSLPVLVRTIRYLLTDAYKRTDCSDCVVHEFISNRLRAVRQDMAVQGLLTSVRAAPLLAASVRYAVLQLYRMCEVSATDYNPFLDMKQLQETLAGLVRLYKDNSNHIPPQPPAFSFDLDDDDEEEYFFEFDFSTGKVRERSAGCGTNNSNGEGSCSGVSCDSNRSDAQTPGDLAGNHWTGEGSGEGECRHTCQTTSDCPDDSGFLSIDNENDRISKAAGGSFVSYRGSDDDEVSRVMTRISAMSLEAMGGEAQAASTAHVDGNSKDDKNRFNKEAGEHVKEQRECFDECVVEKDSNLYVDSPNQSTNNDDSSVNHQTNSNSNSSSLNSSEGNSNDSVTDSDKLSSSVLHESVCEREEMECIYLLLNYDKSEAVEHALELPTFVKEGKVLSRVLPAVLSYHSTGNTTALLRLLHALPPLLCSALYLSLPKLQRKILQVLTTGHSSVNSKYPLLELANQLVLPGADAARRACRHFGLTVTGDQHQFVAFHKNDFSINAPLMPLERAAWLDAKLEASGSSLLLPHPLL